MFDAHDYFQAHAIEAIRKARRMPAGGLKRRQRTIARTYHLLAKEAALKSNVHRMDEFNAARRLEQSLSEE